MYGKIQKQVNKLVSFFLLVKYVHSGDFYILWKIFPLPRVFFVYVLEFTVISVWSLLQKSSFPVGLQPKPPNACFLWLVELVFSFGFGFSNRAVSGLSWNIKISGNEKSVFCMTAAGNTWLEPVSVGINTLVPALPSPTWALWVFGVALGLPEVPPGSAVISVSESRAGRKCLEQVLQALEGGPPFLPGE